MKTSEYAAVAAVHSVDPERWWTEFSAVIDRIAPRFARYEPLRHAAELIARMVSGLDRKNCWTIAEHRGNASPDGLQHLLSRAKWDAEAVRDDLRDYVVDAFGDPGAILVVDETGDVKKGVATVGVQRQYTGTAGRIENAQVAVYLTYAAPRGHALIDRALYLPRCWAEDPHRCDDAGIPRPEGVSRPNQLAAALISRAVQAQVPAAWVAGDEVYGADPRLRAAVRGHGLGYVLAVAANRRVPTATGPIRVDTLPAHLTKRAWQKHSAGVGSHGYRYYSWAWIALLPEDATDTGHHHLLIRRNDATGELAYLRCYSPRPVTLHTLVAVAGQRWRIEESFQAAKGLTGLDQHQVRRWTSWHRWTTLAMLAHAFLAVATATEHDTQPTPAGLIALSTNFDASSTRYCWPPATPSRPCCSGHAGADDTNTEPSVPLQTMPIPMITNYGCSTDMGGGLSRGQGEAAAVTVVAAAASMWPDEPYVGVERVDADACQSEIRGLVTAGPWV